MDDRIHRINENLQGTTRNLRSLDHMLDDYRDVTRDQRSAVDRLREDVARTRTQLHEERLRSPGYRHYESDSEYEGSPSPSRRRRRSRRSTVRFADDMNRELHDLNSSVRDLSTDQFELRGHFNREMDRRERFDSDTRRTMREISENLKRLPQTDPVAMRVESRLASIQNEMRADRHLGDRYDELANLSSDLRHALREHHHMQQSAADERIRNQYIQAEAQKHRIESDLDILKRKLDQSEGGKAALQNQVEDLRNQLNRMEQERARVKLQMEEKQYEEELRERRKRRSVEEDKDRERKAMEREISDLRSQLSRAISAGSEAEELRRGIERSERQRAQLSDHIETLTKDLENREKQTAKLITQLKEVSDKYDESERQKGQLIAQFDDTAQRFKDCNKELDRVSTELRNAQQGLQETERKRDEFKGRAQETVRQWKLKVKQLEREVDRHKHGANQLMQRNEQLVKEVEGHRQNLHHTGIQMENMKRELGDALAVRAAQDEQLRLKDVEINELKSVRMDLDRELRDVRTVADRLENELHTVSHRLTQVTDDKNKMEDKLSSIEAAHILSQDQAVQLQQELKEMSALKAEIAAKLSESNGKIHDLKQNFIELQHREKAAREESKMYQRQLNDERENHHVALEAVKRELNEVKVREAHVMQDIQRKMKRSHAEYEATIQALKMELSEEKSAHKISKRNEEKFRQEVDRLAQEIARCEEDNQKLSRRLEMAREEFETQFFIKKEKRARSRSPRPCIKLQRKKTTQMAETDLSRVKNVEEELLKARNDCKRFQANFEGLIHEMVAEVDALMDIAASGSKEKQKTVASCKGTSNGPSTALQEIKAKMKWLRGEIRDRIKLEQALKKDLQEALSCNETDRHFLMSELAKRDGVLDELSTVKHELSHREAENLHCVETLQTQILDLTDELELRKIREEELLRQQAMDNKHVIEEIEELRGVQEEKARIEQRYIKLQDTMRALQSELKSANFYGDKIEEIEKNMHNLRKSPRRKNHVRIQEGPSLRSRSRSRSKSPGRRMPIS
ncbi:centrosomal protein of 128 kDa-like isoform X1 [Saccostrea echinata]|uniref:centrosomal protein of 128 kDa-like isoform X1 n=1 Tax=Saccostrea echinata TaxID=191078 RepID=UPI002A8079E7|nr:centrosomal protein of 128 kDa-like isoform X1 [Saccostrea echinata]